MATKTATEEIRLYNGEVSLTFYPNSHRYKVDGEWVKSVTGILSVINKPQLIRWAVKLAEAYLLQVLQERKLTADDIRDACMLHEQVKSNAADTGKIIHEWCEQYVKNKISESKELFLPPEDEQAKRGVNAFLDWTNSHKVSWLQSEKFVYSRKYKYVGTYDAGAVIDGETLLVDFKSSKGIYAEMILQTVGYVIADEEENGERYDGIMILRFDKETGEFETFKLMKTDPLYQAAEQAFLWAQHLQKTNLSVENLLKSR